MKKDISQENLIKLEQKLTPEQILVLRVLQTPKLELLESINNELEQNPALLDIESEESQEIEDTEIEELDFDKELKEIVQEDFMTFFEPERDEEKFFEIPASKITLKEYLKEELAFVTSEEEILRIGEYIIELLNEHGFLEYEPEDVARDLNADIENVLKTLRIIMDIEPGGFGLKGIKDYLIYQIRMNYLDDICETIVKEHYNDMIKNDVVGIAKKLKVEPEKIKEYIEKIKKLRPFPANHEFGEVEYVIPDVFVEIEGEELKISINDAELPFIFINPKYIDILKNEKSYDRETVSFVREKVKRGLLFIKGLEMRREVFKKLIEFILNEQKEFITKGEEFKKPLRFKDVSERLNLNISTCSRILKDVYVQINCKVYNIKEFFSLPIKKEYISRDNVKMMIKKIIEEEKEPLKDTQIIEKLKEMGINITRRTVTKYREELNIPPYNVRRNLRRNL